MCRTHFLFFQGQFPHKNSQSEYATAHCAQCAYLKQGSKLTQGRRAGWAPVAWNLIENRLWLCPTLQAWLRTSLLFPFHKLVSVYVLLFNSVLNKQLRATDNDSMKQLTLAAKLVMNQVSMSQSEKHHEGWEQVPDRVAGQWKWKGPGKAAGN